MDAVARASKVFCDGPLLDAVQRAGIFEDSKTFVDRPLKADPEVALEAFANLEGKLDPKVLRTFVEEYFEEEGEDMELWTPSDWTESPKNLAALEDESLRKLALALNDLWKILARRQKAKVASAPARTSALVRTRGMMLPGGRFRETYYWDTYWIVRGLLICGMLETARGIVETLLDDVRHFGFVPNGGRIYYLDRSQPPLLSEMVMAVDVAAPNEEWLAAALPVLEDEYRWWMNSSTGHRVKVPLPDGGSADLNVYCSSGRTPRPESYIEDVRSADRAKEAFGREREEVWHALRSGAESGWDFSARWLAPATEGKVDLSTIDASKVVPVDLNSYLFGMECNLSRLCHRVSSGSAKKRADGYAAAAAERRAAMERLLWDEQVGSFKDFRLGEGKLSTVVALSDFAAPLWVGLQGKGGAKGVVVSLQRSGLIQAGGALTTTLHTGEQWDAPNGWPPLQLMLIEGLDAVRGECGAAGEVADLVAASWLESCLKAWQGSGFMFEKYNAEQPGVGGGGGEYKPQTGFGWSNGVVLALLMRAKNPSADPAAKRVFG